MKLKAGDELFTATVRTLNPNGSDYIYYFNTETLDSMPSSLSEKLIAYDNLVDSYNKNYQINFTDSGLMASYNALIDKYNSDTYKQYKYNDDGESVLTNNSFSKIDGEIKGFNNLINLYYDLIDFKLYLQSSLMPTIIKEADKCFGRCQEFNRRKSFTFSVIYCYFIYISNDSRKCN
ncbi:hypothetical protein SD457_06075 [Coprobacillaceae bacterium CR2/5/TPMF4]|nr:hypothetical protein SD457_06075 [Coprobacillaceae bacterium CR2/5/TPMF4]